MHRGSNRHDIESLPDSLNADITVNSGEQISTLAAKRQGRDPVLKP
jgi:hypothetical protein